MFSNQRSRSVKQQISSLEEERDRLNDSLLGARNDLSELKQKKKMEDENIRHLVRIKEEKVQIEQAKKQVELERQQQEAIAAVKDQYRDKMEVELQKQIARGDRMYSEILARLPDVSVRLKGDA